MIDRSLRKPYINAEENSQAKNIIEFKLRERERERALNGFKRLTEMREIEISPFDGFRMRFDVFVFSLTRESLNSSLFNRFQRAFTTPLIGERLKMALGLREKRQNNSAFRRRLHYH